MSEAIAFVPLESFLDQEQVSSRRHELVGGRIYAQAGGSERHDLTAGLIYEFLAAGARSSGCRPFMSNRLLATPSGNAYYPDVMIACGPAAHRLYEATASLIVEVLSPSTADVDRREKAVAYSQLPTLRQFLLVHPDARRIEIAEPDSGSLRWTAFGPGEAVRTPYGDIDVDALYDAVDRTATTQ